ncbi:MAG: leucyl aminopeptidase [bacterium]
MSFTAKIHTDNLTQASYHALVVPAFENSAFPRLLGEIDKAWRNALSLSYKTSVPTKEGEITVIPSPLQKGIKNIVFIGMGIKDDSTYETVRRAAGNVARNVRKRNISRVCFLAELFVPPDADLEQTCVALVEGARLGSYFFDRFKTEKDTHTLDAAELHLPQGVKVREYVALLDRVLTLTTASIMARDWGNTPGNLATPTNLAQLARDVAGEVKIGCKILERKDCEKAGMGAYLGVSQGSHQPPKFIILDYKPGRFSKTICFVGKAVTFDSGGICLKPATDMEWMKADMCGGISVIGLMRTVGLLKPSNARVIGIIPACENMPGGSALKPGDIIKTITGKSIEVINTDAEGRLTLADGIEFAIREYRPDAVVDAATLTGACVIALGTDIAGFWTDDEKIASALNRAASDTGERVWRMPFEKDYLELLKSEQADLRNVGTKWGGAITAALFLREFAGETSYCHIDIAGPAINDSGWKSYIPKGATGYGPRLLYHFLENWLVD